MSERLRFEVLRAIDEAPEGLRGEDVLAAVASCDGATGVGVGEVLDDMSSMGMIARDPATGAWAVVDGASSHAPAPAPAPAGTRPREDGPPTVRELDLDAAADNARILMRAMIDAKAQSIARGTGGEGPWPILERLREAVLMLDNAIEGKETTS